MRAKNENKRYLRHELRAGEGVGGGERMRFDCLTAVQVESLACYSRSGLSPAFERCRLSPIGSVRRRNKALQCEVLPRPWAFLAAYHSADYFMPLSRGDVCKASCALAPYRTTLED